MMQFKFLNIPVNIGSTFWVFLLVFCFQSDLTAFQMLLLAFIVFFSLLVHEYGHALAAKKFRQNPEITLEGMGGFAAYEGKGVSEKEHFIITLCGPLFTALLIGISFMLLKNQVAKSYSFYYFLYWTKTLNTYWLIVNLAPLHPLDGGKITEYFLKKWLGAKKGYGLTLMLGNIAAVAGTIYFLLNGSYMFAYIFLFHGWKNFQHYKLEKRDRNPPSFVLYQQALRALSEKKTLEAKETFKKLIKSKDPYIKARAVEGLAETLLQEGKEKEAYKILLQADPATLTQGKWLLCKLAYNEKNYSLFNAFSKDAYEIKPTFETALLNAKAFSQLQDTFYGSGWLKTALQFPDASHTSLDEILDDPAFDPIRSSPEFQELHSSVLVDR